MMDNDTTLPMEQHLHLLVDKKALHYAVSRNDGTPPQCGRTPLNATGDFLHAVEDAAYDTPLLLAEDYAAVHLLARASHFAALPAVLDEDSAREAFRASFSAIEGEVSLATCAPLDVTLGFELPRGLHNFLRRTFNNAPLEHALQPLMRFLHSHTQGMATPAMLLAVGDGRLDVVACDGGRLLLVNTFECRSLDEAQFFALNVMKSCRLDAFTTRVLVAHSGGDAAGLTTRLLDYVRLVMPVPLPPCRLAQGSTDDVPFELLLNASAS